MKFHFGQKEDKPSFDDVAKFAAAALSLAADADAPPAVLDHLLDAVRELKAGAPAPD